MANRNLYWQHIEGTDISLTVHGLANPTDEEWDAILEYWAALCEPIVAAGRHPISLNWTIGGSPSSEQRRKLKELHQTFGPFQPRAAVITNSRFARGVVTMLRWLGAADIRAFSLSDFEAACDHLGVFGVDRETLAEKLDELTRVVREAA